MTAPPRLRVEMALELGVLDVPGEEDWTDLSDRVRGFTMRRGRADQTQKFSTGTATVTLDNSDRLLDPQHPDGLVYAADNKGLPLCPARVLVDWDGETWPLMARAFLGPDGWPYQRSAHGTAATIEIELLDPMGAAAWVDMPRSAWQSLVQSIGPDWWIPGEPISDTTTTSEGFELPSHAAAGGHATLGSFDHHDPPVLTSGAALTFLDTSDVVDVDNYWSSGLLSVTSRSCSMIVRPEGYVESAEDDVFPDGDLDEITVSVLWREALEILHPSGEASSIMSVGTEDHLHWLLKLESGAVKLDVYDGAGTLLTTLTAPPPTTSGDETPHYDDGQSHGFVVRITPTEVALFSDGNTVVTETVDVPSAVFAGRMRLGVAYPDTFPGTDTPWAARTDNPATWPAWDELTISRSALDDQTCYRLAGAALAASWWGRGESFEERMTLWYSLCGWPTAVDEDEEWHAPPLALVDPDTEVTMGGIVEVGSWPESLGAAIVQTADAIGGDCYALRDGRVRVRSVLAVTDEDRADTYATVTAVLTDDPDPDSDPPPLRRGPVSYTGTRLDRVVTDAEVSWPTINSVDSHVLARSTWTVAVGSRYGRRKTTQSIGTQNAGIAKALAALLPERYAVPPIEIQAVTIQPLLGSDASDPMLTWLLGECELERAVTVVDTPPVGDPIVMDLQVQGETWTWTDTTLTVTLDLATT